MSPYKYCANAPWSFGILVLGLETKDLFDWSK
jgi:hypothetical protein